MNMNGNLPQKKSYALSLDRKHALLLELLLIVMGGALAALMHFSLRIPLNLPGHHGLEFMAIFILIRLESNLKYAATMATLGVGLFMLIPGMGAGNLFHSISYLLPGLTLDLIYQLSRGRIHILFAAAIIAGIGYASIPISRLMIHMISGYPYMAFVKYGIAYTILSFFFFGMLGGVLGFGLSHAKSIFRKTPNYPNDEKEI